MSYGKIKIKKAGGGTFVTPESTIGNRMNKIFTGVLLAAAVTSFAQDLKLKVEPLIGAGYTMRTNAVRLF